MKGSAVTSIAGRDFQYQSDAEFPDDARWLLAQRVVTSSSFTKSSFLTHFLLYVCDRELNGRVDEITEYQIGINAFGRPPDYNPGIDNVVRNYARLLRKRLEEYFETEGKDEPLRISIPRGRYVPVFHAGAQEGEQYESSPQSSNTTEVLGMEDRGGIDSFPPARRLDSTSRVLRASLILLAIGAVLAAGGFGIQSFRRTRATLSHVLWMQIFNQDRETFIVPADSGFGILQNLTGHPVHLADYVTGTYRSKLNSVARRLARVTGMTLATSATRALWISISR